MLNTYMRDFFSQCDFFPSTEVRYERYWQKITEQRLYFMESFVQGNYMK